MSNAGNSVIPSARLEINVPVNSTSGGLYLYVGRLSVSGQTGVDQVSCSQDGVNPGKLSFTTRSRKRRCVVCGSDGGVSV